MLSTAVRAAASNASALPVQVIVEKAEDGDTDHIRHAFDLFVDFIAMFVRVVIIMLQNAESKEQRRKRRSS